MGLPTMRLAPRPETTTPTTESRPAERWSARSGRTGISRSTAVAWMIDGEGGRSSSRRRRPASFGVPGSCSRVRGVARPPGPLRRSAATAATATPRGGSETMRTADARRRRRRRQARRAAAGRAAAAACFFSSSARKWERLSGSVNDSSLRPIEIERTTLENSYAAFACESIAETIAPRVAPGTCRFQSNLDSM